MTTTHPYVLNPDPEYWKDLALSDCDAARALLDKGLSRQVLLFCHYMLEKMLKALLAQQKILEDKNDKHHELQTLAIKAGLAKEMPKEHATILRLANNWHTEVSYPDDQYKYDIMEDKHLDRHYFNRSFECFCWLYARYSTNRPKEEANE